MTKRAMHINQKISRVRFATADIGSEEMCAFVDSLPDNSDTKQAILALREIKAVGNVAAMDILLALISWMFRDDRPNRRNE